MDTPKRTKKSFCSTDCSFRLTEKKAPFAWCTVSEMLTIVCLLEQYGSISEILRRPLILSEDEKYILWYYHNHGEDHPHLSL